VFAHPPGGKRTLHSGSRRLGRDAMVESRMGAVAWGLWPTPRFPSPLIKPCVRVSRTRLSDWLHREAHGGWSVGLMSCDDISAVTAFALRYELSLTGPDRSRCLQAHRQSPSPCHLRKRTRSQGPLLRRHYPASTLLRPCPTPAMAVTFRNVEAATLTTDGSPPITRTTFPTCRAHYPGGSSGCACR